MNTPQTSIRTQASNQASNTAVDIQQAQLTLDAQFPWPGLAAYDESASEFFFGRAEEAAELLRMVRLAPLTVLYGKSGLGKTSLLQAGFFPLLRAEHYFPVYLRLDFSPTVTLPPIDQAAKKLQTALVAVGADFPTWSEAEGLWHYLHQRNLKIWSKDNYLLTPVLIFDQFEEIFSQGKSDPDCIQSSFHALADLIENRIPSELTVGKSSRRTLSELDLMAQPYRIVLAFREDFLPEIEGWKEQVPSLLRNRLRLLPMTRERAVDAVKHAGAAVLAPDVTELLVDFVGNLDAPLVSNVSAIEPVLLSLCCYQLNQRRQLNGKIDANLLQHAGQDILQDFYDEALGDMPATVSQFIETHLIQGSHYRGSYPVDQALHDGFLTQSQLAVLADKYRLLRIDQQLGANRIELIHDRLVSVVSKARDARLRQVELQRQQTREQAQLRQQALEKAEFDAANLRRHTRKLHGALLLVVCLATIALFNWREANIEKENAQKAQQEANSLRLVLQSLDMANGTRVGGDERAMMQLLAVHQIVSNKEVDAALLSTLLSKHATKKVWTTGGKVRSVAYSPNGRYIVSGSSDGTLRAWDANTGEPIGKLMLGHTDSINSVAISPDSKLIVSGSSDGTLRVWDANSGEPKGRPMIKHTDSVESVDISPDGQYIVSGSQDNTLQLWHVTTREPIGEPMSGHKKMVSSVAFSSDGNRIVSASYDDTMRFWDVNMLSPIGKPLQGHEDAVTSVAFSPDDQYIVSGSKDNTLQRWNVNTHEPIGDPMQGHQDRVNSVAFSPDGQYIVSGSHDRTLRLWEAKNGQSIGAPILGHSELVSNVTFSPEGNYIASGSRDTSLRLWNAKNSQPIEAQLKGGHKNLVASVAFSPNGRYIVSGSDDYTLQRWDAKSGKPIGISMEGHTGSLNGVAFSPDSKLIVSGSSDGTLRLWDAHSGEPIGVPMRKHEDGVESVAFSPNGQYIVSGSKDKTLQLWQVSTRKPIGAPMTGHEKMVRGVAFSSDGNRIVSASYDNTLRLWDVDTLKQIGEPFLGHLGAVTSVAFSPNDQHIVSGSKDNTLQLWDVNTHEPIGDPMQGHQDRVNSVAFSPDGKRIISSSSDKTLRLWDVTSRKAIGKPMYGHLERVNSATFSPDGTRIVSGSDDMTLRIWSASNAWADELCNKLTRNMSQKEWHDWVSPDFPNIQYKQQCPNLLIPSLAE